MSTVRVVEPHPDTSRVHHIYTGRGGAGNSISLQNTKTTPGQSATGPASRLSLLTQSRQRTSYTSGRGGAGNVHSSAERAIFSFDEELESQLRREKQIAPVYHVGRGGAGNLVLDGELRRMSSNTTSGRKGSDARSTTSAESDDSTAERAKDRARRSLERGWDRIVRVTSNASQR